MKVNKLRGAFRKRIPSVIGLLGLCLIASGCNDTNTDPAVKACVKRNPLEQTEFQGYLEDICLENNIPGIAGVVVTSAGIEFKGVSGKRRNDAPEDVTLADLFHIGSNTKAMTAFLAGILVEKGLLHWDTRILDVFPKIEPQALPTYRSATLRDLLSHRARIRPFTQGAEFYGVPRMAGSAPEKRKAFSAWLLTQDPIALGSEGFTYSNAGYSLAAAMLEQISDRSWEELLQQELFEPLGIEGRIGWPASEDQEQPWGHWMRRGKLVPQDPQGNYQLNELIGPAGDVSVSILDYAQWLQTLLCGLKGEDILIQASTVDFLLFANLEFSPYSLGWGSREREGMIMSSHDGSAGTFYCHAVLIKDLDLGLAFLANSAHPGTRKGLHVLSQILIEKYREAE